MHCFNVYMSVSLNKHANIHTKKHFVGASLNIPYLLCFQQSVKPHILHRLLSLHMLVEYINCEKDCNNKFNRSTFIPNKKNNNIDLTQATRVPLWLIQSPQKKTSKIINYLFVTKATLLLRISFLYFLFISFCHKIHFHHTPYFASLFFGKLKCLTEYVFFIPVFNI